MGSTSLTLKASTFGKALLADSLRYYPYGATRSGGSNTPTTFRFTGQRQDANSGGLMYYGARYYDPSLGRFISADTIVPGTGDTQSLNRYSYVRNNPLRYMDPTGHDEDCGMGDPTCTPHPKYQGGIVNQIAATTRTTVRGLTAAGVAMDTLALALNASYTLVADTTSVFLPPAYGAFEVGYQPFSIAANIFSSAALVCWTLVGVQTGESKFSHGYGPEGLKISLSVSQDTVVSGATTLAGWTVLRDFNLATGVDAGVLLYDEGRIMNPLNPNVKEWTQMPLVPTWINPTFTIVYDPVTNQTRSEFSPVP